GVIQVIQVCPNTASFSWNATAGAESYDFYTLGAKYMEVVGTTTINSITIPINDPNDEIWFAAVAKNSTLGWESRRSNAFFYSGGLLNCSITNDLSLISINNDPVEFNYVCNSSPVTVSATIANTGLNPQTNFTMRYQIDSELPIEETYTGTLVSGQQAIYEFNTPISLSSHGDYVLTVEVDLLNDQNTTNNSGELEFYATIDATSIDFTEDFETNGFPPNGWVIINKDDEMTWEERTQILGSDGSLTTTSFINNFDYNEPLEEDTFQTEIFNLKSAISAMITFDLAKAQYSNNFSDGLRVEISTDCGLT